MKQAVDDFPAELSDTIEHMMDKRVERRPDLATVTATLAVLRNNRLRERGKTVVLNPNLPTGTPKVLVKERKAFSPWAFFPIVIVVLAVAAWLLWKSLQ